jgi:ketosteroid isomerase-like protein
VTIETVIDRWHGFMRGEEPNALDELLADDVVFYSPVVYTPQQGKGITTVYLQAAAVALPGDGGDGAFRYTKQVLAGDTAVLEFETTVNGKYVNGVDIIRCNADGHIVEFRVMIRPLQAVNAVHEQMRAQLETMQPG